MPTIEFEGRSIAFSDTGGDGEAVLLFHAFPCDSRLWEGQQVRFRGRYRIVAPDLSGCGASSVPEDPASYSVERWADEGRAVLRALGIERAVVGGMSMGGYVSFAFLRRYPEIVSALVLCDTRADADSPEVLATREAQQREVAEQGTGPLRERMLARLLAPASAAKPALYEKVRDLTDQPAAGMVGTLEALKRRPDSSPDLAGIRVPTLVIVGEQDVVTPPSVAEGMHRVIPGSRLAVLPRAGHLANLEEPEAFDRALGSFLDGR